MTQKTSQSALTVVLGASTNPNRYSFIATDLLNRLDYNVRAVGNKTGQIGQISIERNIPEDEAIDTITLYLSEINQVPYIETINKLKPKRIIFNPGTESDEHRAQWERNGIECIEACTLVMLRTGQY